MMPRDAALIGQLQQYLEDLDQLIQRTNHLLKKFEATQDEDYIGSLALNLHGFYTGVERIFEEIARSIDESLPSEADWHRRSLRQMSAELPEVRPSVITVQTRKLLDEYRAFRHVVRNVYSFELRSDRIQELAANLPSCYQQLKQDIHLFSLLLRQMT